MKPTKAARGPQGHEGVRERRAQEKRVWRNGFLLSVGLHVLILLFGPRGAIPVSPFAAAGPDENDDVAAEGSLEVVALSSAPPAPIIRPPPPIFDAEVPLTDPITPDPVPLVSLDLPEIQESGVGATSGQDPDDTPDAGIPGATGAGDAGTAAAGRFRVIPPSPRGLIIPPTNSDLRGRQIQVWVFVNEQGRVVADSTRLEPPTADRGFNERLVTEASQWVFEPARENGMPVAAWFPYTISME